MTCLFLVVNHLVCNGEKQDEESQGGQKRVEAIRALVKMNPVEAFAIRALCVRASISFSHVYFVEDG